MNVCSFPNSSLIVFGSYRYLYISGIGISPKSTSLIKVALNSLRGIFVELLIFMILSVDSFSFPFSPFVISLFFFLWFFFFFFFPFFLFSPCFFFFIFFSVFVHYFLSFFSFSFCLLFFLF